MSEIIDKFYTPLLTGHGFIRDPDNQQYGDLGICWKLSPEVGEGTYWTYGQKDLYDIKIHNFSFHEDFMLEFSLPECLSITRYDSISVKNYLHTADCLLVVSKPLLEATHPIKH